MRLSLPLLAASLVVLTAGAAGANPQQDESRVVREVVRDFARLRSYRVTAQIQGGLARGADHRIHDTTVSESYRADVYRTITKVEGAAQAFRLRAGRQEQGAIQRDGRWVAILTTDAGRLVQRLFLPPEQVLAQANRLRRQAEWIDDGQGPAARPAPAPGDGRPGDGTQTRDDDDAGEETAAEASHHLRIQGPPEVALEHFITITNSGCFSEG